jgi:CRP-like cAMP-binding protein
MELEDDIALLMSVPSLAVLGEAALRTLAIGAESRSIDEGEVLFEAGERADCGYVVQDGALLLRPNDPANTKDIEVGPGTLLGEQALLTEVRRPATAFALAPATLIRIPRSLFRKVLDSYPDAAARLRDHLAVRAEETAREFSRVSAALGLPFKNP